ncbi:hypothetical protein K2173_024190 [Erythroxylum novogranatense]|uniref:DUF7138 domain-containing protein n=1 Tax=Erythroxylum novogranatense TaxID=1862640 RepID=A0AAV8UCA2_9ROSI|nr:hypothetical protein K2173_024190 [Erythroxylum novogranatense]
MMEVASGALIPAVLFDGEQEINIGDVVVSPSTSFKSFQSIIGDRIGISPYQLSVYVVSQKRRGSRIPITNSTNFSAIYRDKDCFFLVFLKRSRRDKRRKSHEITETYGSRFDPPSNVVLLRRDGIDNVDINGSGLSDSELSRFGYEKRMRELQLEKERYLMSMALGQGIEGLSSEPPNTGAFCAECFEARQTGRDGGFHWCVNDKVTFGFRSSAGPIARPAKGSK